MTIRRCARSFKTRPLWKRNFGNLEKKLWGDLKVPGAESASCTLRWPFGLGSDASAPCALAGSRWVQAPSGCYRFPVRVGDEAERIGQCEVRARKLWIENGKSVVFSWPSLWPTRPVNDSLSLIENRVTFWWSWSVIGMKSLHRSGARREMRGLSGQMINWW